MALVTVCTVCTVDDIAAAVFGEPGIVVALVVIAGMKRDWVFVRSKH